jgi:peroxiredoxin
MKKMISERFGALLSFNTVLTLFLVCSVVINVMLARRVAALKKDLDAAAQDRNLKVGTPVPPMEVKSLDGSPASVSYDGSLTTVFYVFSVTCHWCEQNLDNIKALSASASGRFRFVGISLDRNDPAAVRDYVAKNGLTFPVYYEPSLATYRSYKLGGTPHTIVVSPDGKVVNDWGGAYNAELRPEVENFFGVSLPGIRPMSVDASEQTLH